MEDGARLGIIGCSLYISRRIQENNYDVICKYFSRIVIVLILCNALAGYLYKFENTTH